MKECATIIVTYKLAYEDMCVPLQISADKV